MPKRARKPRKKAEKAVISGPWVKSFTDEEKAVINRFSGEPDYPWLARLVQYWIWQAHEDEAELRRRHGPAILAMDSETLPVIEHTSVVVGRPDKETGELKPYQYVKKVKRGLKDITQRKEALVKLLTHVHMTHAALRQIERPDDERMAIAEYLRESGDAAFADVQGEAKMLEAPEQDTQEAPEAP